MSLPAYTDAETIRNALGVSDIEAPDELLAGRDLGIQLEVELYKWYPAHETLWATYKGGSATDEEKQKGRLLQLYTLWFCVAEVAQEWLALPQRISDGKSDMRRFASLDLSQLYRNAKAKAGSFKSSLLDLEDPARTKGHDQIGLASPAFDPVTGLSS